MRRVIPIGIVLIAVALAVAILVALYRQPAHPRAASLHEIAQKLLNNPVDVLNSRICGGIGVFVTTDSQSGLPAIERVLIKSPADKAGLQVGDLITEVNSVSTSGRTVSQVAEKIKGLAGASFKIVVQRGSTNYQCVIRRLSWRKLKELTYNPYE